MQRPDTRSGNPNSLNGEAISPTSACKGRCGSTAEGAPESAPISTGSRQSISPAAVCFSKLNLSGSQPFALTLGQAQDATATMAAWGPRGGCPSSGKNRHTPRYTPSTECQERVPRQVPVLVWGWETSRRGQGVTQRSVE